MANKRLLVVGGTGRNVGKTEFVCRLIRKISVNQAVYALKVSAIHPEEDRFHSNHSSDEIRQYLCEELNSSTSKDTSRMLRAGAKKVFYLRSDDEEMVRGYRKFLNQIPNNSAIVCESNSLTNYISPAISVVVTSLRVPIKPRAIPLLDSAHLVIVSDHKAGFFDVEAVEYSEADGWHLVPSGKDILA